MYMYDMNAPKKRKTPKDRIVRILYVVAAAPVIVMAMGAAFMTGSLLASVASFGFGIFFTGAVLYKMAKERAGEVLFRIKFVIYAMLLMAAVFNVVMTFVMPQQSLAAVIVPIVLMIPQGLISVLEMIKSFPFLGYQP